MNRNRSYVNPPARGKRERTEAPATLVMAKVEQENQQRLQRLTLVLVVSAILLIVNAAAIVAFTG